MHTKGPWEAESVKSDGTLVYKRIIAGNKSVAFAGVYKGHDAEANARLIASAPDLLAMLELASKYVGKMAADGIETALHPKEALNRINEALSKAKGE